jgi:FkbM family methyltransferase
MSLVTRRQKLKQSLGGAVVAVLGRRRMWRLGRALYRVARNDVDNDPARNGERWLQARLLDAFRDEGRMVVFDVGANVGDWTRMLLDQAPAGRAGALDVYAFEPVRSTLRTFQERLGGHPRFGCVHAVPLALSDADGTVEMYEVEPNGTTNSLHPDPFTPARRVPVQTQTADSFCAAGGIAKVHLLKVDAEGHDFRVLDGAKGVLGKTELVLVEAAVCCPSMENTVKTVVDRMHDEGYSLVGIVDLNEFHVPGKSLNGILWLVDLAFCRTNGDLWPKLQDPAMELAETAA